MSRSLLVLVLLVGCTADRSGLQAPDITVVDASLPDVAEDAASCSNGLLDDDETDVDCGGECSPCGVGSACKTGGDCRSARCNNEQCEGNVVAPSCDDSTRNQDESDVDCGGRCSPCASGKKCNALEDCLSEICSESVCIEPSTCANQRLDEDETDVDCGGSCDKCTLGKRCDGPADCLSDACTGGRCVVPPSCNDGIRNQDEIAVDCGGVCAGCALGVACTQDDDCLSGLCDERCVDTRSLVVPNFSFEDTYEGPRGATAARNWSAVSPEGGSDPIGSRFSALPDGVRFHWINLTGFAGPPMGSTISDPIGTYEEGEYTLTVALGSRRDGQTTDGSYTIELLADGAPIASGVVNDPIGNYATDSWNDESISVRLPAGNENLGRQISVRLSATVGSGSPRSQGQFDNVRVVYRR